MTNEKKNPGLDYNIDVEKAQELIRQKPEYSKITLDEIGEIIGCGGQILSDLKGKRKTTPKQIGYIMKLAELAGCTVEELVKKTEANAEA